MTKSSKSIVGLALGGLLAAGAVFAASYPSLTPIAALREPSVVVKTATGTVTAISATSVTLHVAATKKVAAADYTLNFNNDTKFYYRNSVQGTAADIAAGDTIKVWSVKLIDGTAIKVWDRKLWIGSKTGRVSEVVAAVAPEAGSVSDSNDIYGSLTLNYNSKIAYHAVGTASTVIVKETQATAVNGSIPTETATWADLHNPVAATPTAGATLGTKITATGLWNDTQKMWYLSRIVIKYNQR